MAVESSVMTLHQAGSIHEDCIVNVKRSYKVSGKRPAEVSLITDEIDKQQLVNEHHLANNVKYFSRPYNKRQQANFFQSGSGQRYRPRSNSGGCGQSRQFHSNQSWTASAGNQPTNSYQANNFQAGGKFNRGFNKILDIIVCLMISLFSLLISLSWIG